MIRLFLPGPLTADELRRLTAEREGLFKQDLMAGPLSTVAGVEPFLAALRAKDVRTALATSAASGNADLALRRVGLDKTFDARITAADVTAGKPDPGGLPQRRPRRSVSHLPAVWSSRMLFPVFRRPRRRSVLPWSDDECDG